MDARKYLETPFVKGGRGDLSLEQNQESLRDSSFTKELYDRILLDAPCSAEGRIHIDNEKSF